MKHRILALLLSAAILASFCGCGGSDKSNIAADNGVYYEIFVRAFADSDGDGIGDLNGVVSKLDYLNDGNPETDTDLGITGIWLMPIFESPSYHGYDVEDYYEIESDYGTIDDFKNLLTEAHKRGISVIIDLPINHTSVENEWFIESKDPNSEYRDWYRWSDGSDADIESQIWGHNVWNEDQSGYYSGLFWSGMPDLNFNTPEVREECKSIAKYWLDMGCDGFRFDGVPHVYNEAKLYNNETGDPAELGTALWQEIADACREVKPDCYMVGEVWTDIETDRPDYVKPIGSVFNFDVGGYICSAVNNGKDNKGKLMNSVFDDIELMSSAAPDYIDAIFLSNHDSRRSISYVGKDIEKAKSVAAIYLTMQGLPFIYYGEEIGMIGGNSCDEEKRLPFKWGDSDAAQTSWYDDSLDSDVSDEAEQDGDPDSLLNRYRELIKLRTNTPALRTGKMAAAEDTGSESVIAWYMETEGQKVLVMHNLSAEEQTASCTADTGEIIFTTDDGVEVTGGSAVLPPLSCVVVSVPQK